MIRPNALFRQARSVFNPRARRLRCARCISSRRTSGGHPTTLDLQPPATDSLGAMRIIKSLLLATAVYGFIFGTLCFADETVKPIVPTNHIELFSGKDFTGWKFVMRNNAEPEKTWSITNGVIHCTGQPY